jgi:hypothetical protein
VGCAYPRSPPGPPVAPARPPWNEGRQVTDGGPFAQDVIVGEEIMERGRSIPRHAHELSRERGQWYGPPELPSVDVHGVCEAKKEPTAH